jgi:hypothetical protein
MVVTMSNVKTYAVINEQTNIVENVILWDGESPWQPPAGTYVQSLEGTEAGIGWKFENETFVDVRPTDELRAQVEA